MATLEDFEPQCWNSFARQFLPISLECTLKAIVEDLKNCPMTEPEIVSD